MKTPSLAKYIAQDSVMQPALILTCVLILGQWIVTAIYSWQLPPEIPMFNSLPIGENQLANKLWFMLLPSISVCFLVLNFILIRLSIKANRTYSQVLVWISTLIIALISVAMGHKVFLVM